MIRNVEEFVEDLLGSTTEIYGAALFHESGIPIFFKSREAGFDKRALSYMVDVLKRAAAELRAAGLALNIREVRVKADELTFYVRREGPLIALVVSRRDVDEAYLEYAMDALFEAGRSAAGAVG